MNLGRWSERGKGALIVAVLAAAVWVAPASGEPQSSAVNAKRALAMPMRELTVEAQPLSKVLDYFRSVTGANIVVNWTVLETANVTRDTPITLQVRDLSMAKMMQLVLNQASPQTALVASVEDNVIEITSQDEADKQLVTKVYIVDDLMVTPNPWGLKAPQISLSSALSSGGGGGGGSGFGGGGGGSGFGGGGGGGGFGGSGGGGGLFGNTQGNATNTQSSKETMDKQGDDLVQLIREVVRPNIWRENNGPATIRYFNGKLIVTAPISVHEAIGGPINSSSGIRFGE